MAERIPHRGRLPRSVLPGRYAIRIEPDLEAFTFAGEETIEVTVSEPVEEIVLNAAEVEIQEVAASDGGGNTLAGTARLDAEAEQARLRFARPLAPGPWRLSLRFAGVLNDRLHGFYRSAAKAPHPTLSPEGRGENGGCARWLAVTQFEPTDARRAFPCWDEPTFKAVFEVTLVVDKGLAALSNSRVIDEQPIPGRGKKAVRFAPTIPLPTYLVAFVVGELEATEPTMVDGVPLRIWCVPGKRRLAPFAQEIAAFSLRFFQDYYGLPYPGDKLDLIALPDFASGAMENLGAITFRETALLVDEATATRAELERVADVVAHEIAHMWFGDLVTMAWWNGLWLNEAFATFMEMLAVDAWKPAWERWVSFGVSRAAALGVDGLLASRPIEFEVAAPRDAEAMFDVLTYEKGAAVLRMLEQYLGAAVFRDGIRKYLVDHRFGSAETHDLWTAIGAASKHPVRAIMDGWIFRPGYPLVTITPERGGRALAFAQRRFAYVSDGSSSRGAADEPQARRATRRGPMRGSSRGAADEPEASGHPPKAGRTRRGPNEAGVPGLWRIPINCRVQVDGEVTQLRILLSSAEERVELPGRLDWVVANEGGHGFYRVRYAPELLARLAALRFEVLTAIERFNLINDAWAAALAGLCPVAEYLDLTAYFRDERDRNVWAALLVSFAYLDRVVAPAARPALAALIRDRLGPAVARLGWSPAPGESELTRQLRGDLLRMIGTLGDHAAIQAEARERYARYRHDPAAVDPNVVPALVAILAHSGGEAEYAEFLARFKAAPTPQEEQRYLYALAGFRDPALLRGTLQRAINGEVRSQDAPFVVRSLLMSVDARELAWPFVKEQWETMERQYPKSGFRRMCEGIVGLATPELEADVRAFFASRGVTLGGKTLEQYLEQLRVAVAFREREAAGLAAYLARAPLT